MREYISSSSAAQTQYADLRHEITVLREALDDDLAERLVFFPSATSGDWYVFPHSIGEGMFLDSRETFPDANADMRDACNCYATDNYTAAVFHSMRVAEHGLRGLAKTLPVSFGKGRPVEFEQWGMIIGKLRQKIESLNAKSQEAKPKRQERLAFYSEAIDQCVYFKNLWRDDVSHARRGYSGSQALDGLLRVRDFMKLLADNGVKLPPKRP